MEHLGNFQILNQLVKILAKILIKCERQVLELKREINEAFY